MDAGLELAERRIFLVHYPHYAHAMAATGDWDLVCCGHSHKVEIDQIKNLKGGITYLVNPGTIGGVGRTPATFVMGDLASMTFDTLEISKQIELEAGYR
jgi:predicted phosphodiesterase